MVARSADETLLSRMSTPLRPWSATLLPLIWSGPMSAARTWLLAISPVLTALAAISSVCTAPVAMSTAFTSPLTMSELKTVLAA